MVRCSEATDVTRIEPAPAFRGRGSIANEYGHGFEMIEKQQGVNSQ
jgi:hypothetical protein